MRITQVNYAYDRDLRDPYELVERYQTLRDWSEALADAGADRVTVVQRFRRNETLEHGRVRYVFCRAAGASRPRAWTPVGSMHAAVVESRGDLVHVNGLVFPAQLKRLRRVLPATTAIVVQDHASRPPVGVPAFYRRWLKRCLASADAVWFTAEEQSREWRASGCLAAETPVAAVPESSTTLGPLPRDEARALTGMSGAPALLWIGHLNRNKDPLTVLEGFRQSLQRLPHASLTMVFATSLLLPEIRRRLEADPALAARVTLAGRIPHAKVAAYLSSADLFVLGSHREGSGYALIEALACGVVPVVTDIPSFRALTGDGRVGVLFPPGDAGALAHAIVKAHGAYGRDPALARAGVQRHFSRALAWPTVAALAMAEYDAAITHRRQRHAK